MAARHENGAGRAGLWQPAGIRTVGLVTNTFAGQSALKEYAVPVEEVLAEYQVDVERGLAPEEARQRLERYGPNEFDHARRRGALAILVDQFKSVVLIILAVAAVAALLTAQWTEAVAIAAVILVNATIGFVTEFKAVRSMEALRDLTSQAARVRRQGQNASIPSAELVPGDVVRVEQGDLVPADLRILQAQKLRVSEAALTGESVPVYKVSEPVEEAATLAERRSMLYKGTSISDGSALALVVATGSQTELGRISQLAEEAESGRAPLQQRLDDLGRYLAYITIAIAVLVAITGLWAGRETRLMLETAIALGVAAIPEGLPIVATIALARGMWLMAQRHALINRLTAVETLGATRVIFTDKTGTLTENRMTLETVATAAGDRTVSQGGPVDELERRAIEIGVLCNGATLGDDSSDSLGDPTEIALLRAGQQQGMPRTELLDALPEVRVEDFDTDTMMMATFHQREPGCYVAVKGAPHAVFAVCSHWINRDGEAEPFEERAHRRWNERMRHLAARGLRMLAVADKQVETAESTPYAELRLVGLVGLLDPPREEIREAINRCQSAGIRVLMVTGDEPTTGQAIGRAVGIGDDEEAPAMHGKDLTSLDQLSDEQRDQIFETVVFARVSPEQKLDLVEMYQRRGEPVAMTGDGVNDAPALKKADIGVAMGKRGTDAAKQTADMVLQDDSFGSIVAAIEQGRIIFANIRKSVMFMLCTNVAEILAVTTASLAGWPIPLTPLQILFLNVVTDVFPALALGIGRGRPEVMQQPPRPPGEAILTRHHWKAILGWSVVIATCVLSALLLALWQLGYADQQAITVSFLTLAFGKLWFVLNLRDHDAKRFDNDIVRNGWLWAATGLCIVILLAAVYLPGLSEVLQTMAPDPSGWALILALSLAPAVIGLSAPGIRFHRASETSPEQEAAANRDSGNVSSSAA